MLLSGFPAALHEKAQKVFAKFHVIHTLRSWKQNISFLQILDSTQ